MGTARYNAEAGECDLARFVDSSVDAQVWTMVSAGGEISRADYGTVWNFARRRAVQALRAGDPQLAVEGLLALSCFDSGRWDFRDMLVAAGLLAHSLERTGGDVVAEFERASAGASAETAKHFRRFDGHDVDALRLSTWGYTEVTSEDGPCFLEWYRAPYNPTVDLAARSMRMAADLAATGHRVTSIAIAEKLQPYWFPESVRDQVANMRDDARGGAVLHATGDLIIWLIETADANQARKLAAWGSEQASNHASLALNNGQLLVLAVSKSITRAELERLRDALAGAIGRRPPSASPA